MRRTVLASLWAVTAYVLASPTPTWAQTAPAVPAASGALVPFWLVRPVYHQLAAAARVQGVVVVALTVGADGRVQSATIERDIPLLSQDVLRVARDSGFICRGCKGPMPFRLEYHFQFADSIEQEEAARVVITSTSATLPVVARTPIFQP